MDTCYQALWEMWGYIHTVGSTTQSERTRIINNIQVYNAKSGLGRYGKWGGGQSQLSLNWVWLLFHCSQIFHLLSGQLYFICQNTSILAFQTCNTFQEKLEWLRFFNHLVMLPFFLTVERCNQWGVIAFFISEFTHSLLETVRPTDRPVLLYPLLSQPCL